MARLVGVSGQPILVGGIAFHIVTQGADLHDDPCTIRAAGDISLRLCEMRRFQAVNTCAILRSGIRPLPVE